MARRCARSDPLSTAPFQRTTRARDLSISRLKSSRQGLTQVLTKRANLRLDQHHAALRAPPPLWCDSSVSLHAVVAGQTCVCGALSAVGCTMVKAAVK
jgi:hypothetical protein